MLFESSIFLDKENEGIGKARQTEKKKRLTLKYKAWVKATYPICSLVCCEEKLVLKAHNTTNPTNIP